MRSGIRIFILVLVSFVFIAGVVFFSLFVVKPASEKADEYVSEIISDISERYGVKISFDSVSFEIRRGYVLNNLRLQFSNGQLSDGQLSGYENDEYISVENVSLKTDFIKFIRYLLTGKINSTSVRVSGINALFREDSLNLISGILSENKSGIRMPRFDRTEVKVKDAYLNLIYSTDNGLEDANMTVGSIYIESGDYGLSASAEDITADICKRTFKLKHVHFNKLSGYSFSENLSFADIEGVFDNNELSLNSAELNSDNLEIRSLKLVLDFTGRLTADISEFSYVGEDGVKVNAADSSVSASFQFDESITDSEFTVGLSISEVYLYGLFDGGSYLGVQNLKSELSYAENFFNLSLNSHFLIPYVEREKEDTTGADIKFNITGKDIRELISLSDLFPLKDAESSVKALSEKLKPYEVELEIYNLSSSLISEESHIVFIYSDGVVIADMEFGNLRGVDAQGYFELDFNTLLLKFNLLFSRFYIHDYQPLLSIFMGEENIFYSEKTRIDGNFEGQILIDKDNPIFWVNTDLSILRAVISGREIDFELKMDSELSGDVVVFPNISINALGFEVDASGQFDLKTFRPSLHAEIINTNLNTRLATADILPDEKTSFYTYRVIVDYLKDIEIEGSIEFPFSGSIITDAVVKTPIGLIPMMIELDAEAMVLKVKSEKFYLEMSVTDGITLNITFFSINFTVPVSTLVDLSFTMFMSGTYDIVDHSYLFNISDFRLDIADNMSVGGSSVLRNGDIVFSDMWYVFETKMINPDGTLHIRYNSLSELISGDTSSLDIVADFKSRDSNDRVAVSVFDNAYSLNVDIPTLHNLKISLLGERGSGFYADCSFSGIDFSLRFYSGVINVFNVSANITSFEIKDFSLNFDLNNFLISGSITCSRMLQFRGERQSVTLDFNVSREDLRNSVISIFSNSQPIRIQLKIRNAYLGMGYKLSDTDVSLTLFDELLSITGELINGTYSFPDKLLNLTIDKKLLFGFSLQAKFGSESDIYITDIYFPVSILNPFMDTPLFEIGAGVLTGDLLISGNMSDPVFYGSLYMQELKLKLFWLPDQVLTMNNVFASINANNISISENYLFGHSDSDNRFYDGYFTLAAKIESLSLTDMKIEILLNEKPLYLWLPLYFGESLMVNIEGDAAGRLELLVNNGVFGIGGDLILSDFKISLSLPEMPDWFYSMIFFCSMDVNLIMGKNVNFFYPDESDPFMNFVFNEGEEIYLSYDSVTNNFGAEGRLSFKTGRIFYFNNDFVITGGNLSLARSILNSDELDFSLNLNARLRQYDISGNRVDIYLILQNSKLDNISPRLESVPDHTESEILRMLGNAAFPAEDGNISVSSLASFAVSATSAMSSLGVIDTSDTYSLSSVIRRALGLDLLVMRSPLIENMVLGAINGFKNNNFSLVSSYFNGTSIYAGKYINSDIFAGISLSLRSQDKNSGESGMYFLSDDLKLDLEISFDWDNPLGSFSLFSQVHELSVIGFLDNIGFTFTRRFSF